MMDSQNLSPRRALLSVANKDGITTFARGLADRGFEIVSSGGTADAIAADFHTNFENRIRSDGHCRPHRGHPGEARGPGVHGTGYLKGGEIPPPPLSRGPGDDEDPHGPNCLGFAAARVDIGFREYFGLTHNCLGSIEVGNSPLF